jgi:hypothetical protein
METSGRSATRTARREPERTRSPLPGIRRSPLLSSSAQTCPRHLQPHNRNRSPRSQSCCRQAPGLRCRTSRLRATERHVRLRRHRIRPQSSRCSRSPTVAQAATGSPPRLRDHRSCNGPVPAQRARPPQRAPNQGTQCKLLIVDSCDLDSWLEPRFLVATRIRISCRPSLKKRFENMLCLSREHQNPRGYARQRNFA